MDEERLRNVIIGSVVVVVPIALEALFWILRESNKATTHGSHRFAAALVRDDPGAAPKGGADYVRSVRANFGPISSAPVIDSRNHGVNTGTQKALDQFQDHTITRVEPNRAGDGWMLSFEDSTCIGLAREDFDVDVPPDLMPRRGDTVRLYGPGIGYEVHGVDLNGRRLWHRTQAERQERHERWVADWRRQLREQFDRDRDELDAKVAALSAPLRARIERGRSENPDFRWKCEAYELVACVDAGRIVAYLRREHGWTTDTVPEEQAREAVQAFKNLSWTEQRARIPELDDRHTGNTFGGACGLAHALLTGQRV